MAINRDLRREDFPFTIVALRADTKAWCWAVTLLEPPGDALIPLRVPPLAKWEGVPIIIVARTWGGRVTTTGPYGPDMM